MKARQGLELPPSASMWRGVTLGAAGVGEPGGLTLALALTLTLTLTLAPTLTLSLTLAP